MRALNRYAAACSLLVALATVSWLHAAAGDLDAAFDRYWKAKSPGDAARPAGEIVRIGAPFKDVFARLRHGRPYSRDVATGVVRGRRAAVPLDFTYSLDVPTTYDPARMYQVRVQLHGGVLMREDSAPRGPGGIGRLAGAEQIYVLPAAWRDAPWWTDVQLENLRVILDTVKRTYNVDENRVALAGISDGGTAVYYVAMRDATPYSSFLTLNGAITVLRNPAIGAHGDLFPGNLRNKPFFVVNGGRDELYPPAVVEPYVEHLRRGGVSLTYLPQSEAGHDTSWWPEVKTSFERFVHDQPRVALPDRLTWETSDTRRSGRAHWLVIESLGAQPGDNEWLDDLNVLVPKGREPALLLFKPAPRSGRVDLLRTGNTVVARSHGVAEFTLLLSPEQFDLGQPVRVTTNGRVAFEGRVEPSVATLMKWAARDNDRTQLFGVELRIQVR